MCLALYTLDLNDVFTFSCNNDNLYQQTIAPVVNKINLYNCVECSSWVFNSDCLKDALQQMGIKYGMDRTGSEWVHIIIIEMSPRVDVNTGPEYCRDRQLTCTKKY